MSAAWIAALVAAVAIVVAPARALAADGFGTSVPGQRVYDRAGALGAADVSALEARAQALAAAGAPTVVYIRAQEANDRQTIQDARDLMRDWAIESAPGAHNGLVLFVNLTPGDLRHGHAALYAGERHATGNLPEYELQRIYDRVMLPLLKDGALAAGLAAGLDAAAESLRNGPAPPPAPGPAQLAARWAAGLPLNALAALAALWVVLRAQALLRLGPATPPAGAPRTAPPSDLSPALVGAVVKGEVRSAQVLATVLELARRGALAIEPAGRERFQIRLLRPDRATGAVEASVWRILAAAAGAENGAVVTEKGLKSAAKQWDLAEDVLRDDLLARGWSDPDAPQRRRPLYVASALAAAAGAAAAIIALVGSNWWGGLATAVLLSAAAVSFGVAYDFPDTSAAGEQVAAPWRSYLAGIKAAGRDASVYLDLDAALPYALAMEAAGALDRRVKEASAHGFAPAWFARRAGAPAQTAGGFYPYWIAFAASSASSGATSGAGAATGGAGAGGGF
jgi:uncharacterized membrane protein YgcG